MFSFDDAEKLLSEQQEIFRFDDIRGKMKQA